MNPKYQLNNSVPARLPKLLNTDYLKEATPDALRVLLFLALSDYSASVNEIADECGLSLSSAALALEYWNQTGFIQEIKMAKTRRIASDSLSHGNSKESARIISEYELKGCIETCESIIGQQLNSSSIATIVSIVNDLGVSQYYVTTLLSYCKSFLSERGISIHYLEKTAISLCDQGIRSDEALEEYIKQREHAHSFEGQIRRLYGFGQRKLSEKELSTLVKWFSEYGYPMEIIDLAYDKTVETATKVTLTYTDKILKTWHENGLKTKEDIQVYIQTEKEKKLSQKEAKKKSVPAKKAPDNQSFDANDFLASALERSYGKKG